VTDGSAAQRRRRIDALFAEALERPAAEREGFLTEHTAGDDELRAAVEGLLAAAEDSQELAPGGGLGGALGEDLMRRHEDAQGMAVGSRIGPYRILGELGRGGMAVVYRAERVEGGFEQKVAVKLLRRGIDTDEILRRFVQERQILATLEHPAIARLLDGGVTADGLPYFAMELVAGLPIDQYCTRGELSLERRLELFLKVCRAVEHAHQRLVVHRDLKPSNVLVTADGQVKLLDFGISKMLASEPDRYAAPTTRTQVRLLTPEYASPEQVRGEPVTTATDAYQLGLMLYELLTERRPFKLVGRSPAQVEEAICHQPPEAPSTAVTRVLKGPVTGEAAGGLERHSWARRLRGDLDNIVLMALRKEPERRYPSVGAMAQDIERFLEGRPVTARPSSLGYRASKFIHRHRWVMAAVALVLVLITALVSWYSLSLARERDRARREARKASEVVTFLSGILGSADPMASGSGDLTSRGLLDEGMERMERDLADQPEIRAELLSRAGEIYRNLGIYDEAERRLRESLVLRRELYGEDSLEAAEGHHLLGDLLLFLDRFGEVRREMEVAVEIRRARLGLRHPAVAHSLRNLAEAERAFGNHQRARESYEEAISILEEAYGPEDLEVARTMIFQARHFSQLEERQRAIELLERSLRVRETQLGSENLLVGEVLAALASEYLEVGKPELSRDLLDRALSIGERALGPDHPKLGLVYKDMARTLIELGEQEAALELVNKAWIIGQKGFGPNHPTTLIFEDLLVLSLEQLGREREALAHNEHCLQVLEERLGPDNSHLLQTLLRQVGLLWRVGDEKAARAVFRRALRLAQGSPRPPDRHLQRLSELAAELGETVPFGLVPVGDEPRETRPPEPEPGEGSRPEDAALQGRGPGARKPAGEVDRWAATVSSFSVRSATTAPTTMIAGERMPAAAARSGRSAREPTTILPWS
jgi:serine/threonine-protein kinase